MNLIAKLVRKYLVNSQSKINFRKNKIYDVCQLGKQTRSSFKLRNIILTTKPLELLHMDLFGPTRTISLDGKKYRFVIIDDYSRFAWILFLAHEDKAFDTFSFKKIINKKGLKIRCHHNTKFKNQEFNFFCFENSIDIIFQPLGYHCKRNSRKKNQDFRRDGIDYAL